MDNLYKQYFKSILLEIQLSKANIEKFKQKYGLNNDDDEIKEIFNRFNSQQSRLDNKDIFGYQNIETLKSHIFTKSNKEKAFQAKEGAKKVFENDKVLVIRIDNQKASCYYGSNTKWCISAKRDNAWNSYLNSTFYFIIDKQTNKKYAVGVDKDNEIQEFRDEEDNDIKSHFHNYIDKWNIPANIFKSTFTWDKWLSRHDYEIVDGKVNIKGNVKLEFMNLTKLPFQFGIVDGNFYCSYNNLTTLEGAPEVVKGNFYCDHNNLTTLEGAPEIVNGAFDCDHNNLTTLEGAPKIVKGNFYCRHNPLKSLKGIPAEIGGAIYVPGNFTEEDIKNAQEESRRNLKY